MREGGRERGRGWMTFEAMHISSCFLIHAFSFPPSLPPSLPSSR